jgi:hypothetical protein
MNERSYVGIDKTENNEWTAVMWEHKSFVFSRPYRDTPTELEALMRFIIETCERPKICLNTANPRAFTLLNYIVGIPGAEVVLMTKEGLRLHLDWLPKEQAVSVSKLQKPENRACLLACCAERMI